MCPHPCPVQVPSQGMVAFCTQHAVHMGCAVRDVAGTGQLAWLLIFGQDVVTGILLGMFDMQQASMAPIRETMAPCWTPCSAQGRVKLSMTSSPGLTKMTDTGALLSNDLHRIREYLLAESD